MIAFSEHKDNGHLTKLLSTRRVRVPNHYLFCEFSKGYVSSLQISMYRYAAAAMMLISEMSLLMDSLIAGEHQA